MLLGLPCVKEKKTIGPVMEKNAYLGGLNRRILDVFRSWWASRRHLPHRGDEHQAPTIASLLRRNIAEVLLILHACLCFSCPSILAMTWVHTNGPVMEKKCVPRWAKPFHS